MAPRLKHNNDLAQAFMAEHKVYSRYPKVSEQVATEPLRLEGLKPFGYNPSITEHGGFTVMAYRYHADNTLATKLRYATLNPDGEVLRDIPLEAEGKSVEDPRLILRDKEVWMGFTSSIFPDQPYSAVIKFGRIKDGGIGEIIQPSIGKNDWSGTEKNWVFFTHEGRLNCIYRCHPQQEIYWLDGLEPVNTYTTAGPKWAYGPIKGGTPPVQYEGTLLRFFHSTLDNEFGKYNRRYYVGAYTMAAKPPYQVFRVSKKPIIYGSEVDDLKVKERPFHWKANVVFPAGVTIQPYGWCVSVGINDSACLLAKVRPEDLNL